ncbi:gamma-glutamyl hydrolase-like [Planococcus citri]|uniref:gamma-glutamyl hydrolase-like n=1 Tax=Planococcus citri TaxID=170843 RepID=UPI0031F7A7B2
MLLLCELNMAKIAILINIFFLLQCGFCKRSVKANKSPIIGVLSQELLFRNLELFPASSSFIAASYVKAVESSGARVVPVVINKPESYYRNILNSVNGLVLPGGATFPGDGNPYYDSVKMVYKIAKEMNENGTTFPILGVCLGYEFMLIVANNDNNILKRCNVTHENLPIKFHSPYFQSTLFSRLSTRQAHTLQYLNSTVNFHRWCAHVTDFDNSNLNQDWRITSTSTSLNNTEFIASVEHKKYPFFAIQFHPEKVSFEWNPDHNIPHSEPIVLANRYFYDQLIYHAKKNFNKFATIGEENNSLIYNYFPRFTASVTSYLQMYVF